MLGPGCTLERRKPSVRIDSRGKKNSLSSNSKGKPTTKIGESRCIKAGKRPRHYLEEVTYLNNLQRDFV